jgi:hypothetical protein
VLGVPAASAATKAALFLLGSGLVAAALILLRGRLTGLRLEERLVVAAVALSLVALPWIGWRFVEDLRTTTRLDPYERANMGPIQAYLPGYVVSRARVSGATWATQVGPVPNQIARRAFPSLALISLFPRPSAPPGEADALLRYGFDPEHPYRVVVVHHL